MNNLKLNLNPFEFTTKKAIIIDGHSLAYRAYFATLYQMEHQVKNNQKPTNALKMMLIMISTLLKRKKYDYGLVAFDTSRKSFRSEMFDEYKSNRKAMDLHLVNQLPLIEEAIKLMGFKIIAIPNFEADDIIGTFAQFCNQAKVEVDIFSSDNDLLQLVNTWTNVHILKKGVSDIKIYNNSNFQDLYHGIEPYQIIHLKSIAGDSSDNYKGVQGIGPKGALKIIQQFKTIYNVFQQINQIEIKVAEKLLNAKKDIELFLKLATIMTDVDIPIDLNQYLFSKANEEAIANFLEENNINNLKIYF